VQSFLVPFNIQFNRNVNAHSHIQRQKTQLKHLFCRRNSILFTICQIYLNMNQVIIPLRNFVID